MEQMTQKRIHLQTVRFLRDRVGVKKWYDQKKRYMGLWRINHFIIRYEFYAKR